MPTLQLTKLNGSIIENGKWEVKSLSDLDIGHHIQVSIDAEDSDLISYVSKLQSLSCVVDKIDDKYVTQEIKEIEEEQKQIDELRSQLEASTKKELKYPKSEDELTQWMEKYPDVAKIVETIAMKKANETASEYETKFRQIDEMKLEAQREKAEAELMRIHPDFEEIRDTDEFHTWVEEQPKWVQDALYDNDSDAVSAARAIDLYKADKGITGKKKSSSDKNAAKAIGTRSERSAPESDESKSFIKESDVAKMSSQQYEKMADEIAEAIRTGKFIYDLSGSAR